MNNVILQNEPLKRKTAAKIEPTHAILKDLIDEVARA